MLPLAPFVTTAADFRLAAAGDGGRGYDRNLASLVFVR